MSEDLLDLDAAGLLAASSGAVRDRRLAEVRDLEVLSEGRVARRVGNVLRRVGGEGTPGVPDFCLGEIVL